MKTISVLNEKGGTGKTTIALNLAMGLAMRDKKVILVDADPQGSARDWSSVRKEEPAFSVIALDRPTIHRDLGKIARGFDFAVVDGPPRTSALTRSAMMASDIVLIPVQPSPFDAWAAKDLVDMLEDARTVNRKMKALFVINRSIVNTAIGRDVVEALGEYKLPILDAVIHQRVGLAECAAHGSTIQETAPTSEAAREIEALVSELWKGYLK